MIASMLDNDLYKFTMQQAVRALYPQVHAAYELIQRRAGDRFTPEFLAALDEAIADMAGLQLRADELAFLRERCPYLQPDYVNYLGRYRYDPDEVAATVSDEGRLSIKIAGPWHRTILWEVPLLAMVCELYGRLIDTRWTMAGQVERAREKGRALIAAGCTYADFGTRRRRDYATQELVVGELRAFSGFSGTSNVHLAQRYATRPIGTMAHEWIMAQSVLGELRHANRLALAAWHEFYDGQLGIALTDTYGTPAFFADFDEPLARAYQGVRQDSGEPFVFADRMIAHYRRLGIDPAAKTIVFSDGLTPELAVRLQQHCAGRIRASFGIGTNLTNDFAGSRPLEVVIKLVAINGRAVAKLTDDPGKASGTPEAIAEAHNVFGTLRVPKS